MKRIINTLRTLWNFVKPMTRQDAVKAGICDYSGQGRNVYGK